jgi:hypothetical protein
MNYFLADDDEIFDDAGLDGGWQSIPDKVGKNGHSDSHC